MRWYWILIGFTLFALTAASPKALLAVQHLMPTTGSAAMPIILLSLAVLSAFAALVLSSRNFGLLALAFGLGMTWMQQGYLHSLTRLADAAPRAELQLSLTLSNVLHGAGNTMQNEGPWLLPLTLCALLMAGVLMLRPRVE